MVRIADERMQNSHGCNCFPQIGNEDVVTTDGCSNTWLRLLSAEQMASKNHRGLSGIARFAACGRCAFVAGRGWTHLSSKSPEAGAGIEDLIVNQGAQRRARILK